MGKRENIMFDSGSMQENTQRLGVLYTKHHQWLLGTAYNISKKQEFAEDLVGELYCYLGEKVNPKLWAKDSFNILYCIQFIQSRFINKVKRDARIQYKGIITEEYSDVEYDIEYDERLEQCYDEVLREIESVQKTGMWVSAKLYKMYWVDEPDETLEGISKKIGISNSTSFLHIKKMKQHLKDKLKNPFQND
jgi:hypothetical protein